MNQPKLCQDPNCNGRCGINEKGEIVMHPIDSPEISGITSVGRDLIQQMRKTGAIGTVSCIWEDTSPSYTIQMREDCQPGQAADLLSVLSHLRLPIRIVSHMADDCKGRRIF